MGENMFFLWFGKTIDEVNTWIQKHNLNIKCIYYDGTTNSRKTKFICLIAVFIFCYPLI